MSRSDIMMEINSTISQIASCCYDVSNSMDASYVANNVEMWLDQLRREIEEYNNAEEEEEY